MQARAINGYRAVARFEYVPLEVEPREHRGIDFGNTGTVLVRCGETRIVWRRGSKVFAGRGEPREYHGAHLQVLTVSDYGNLSWVDIDMGAHGYAGSRLTWKVFAKCVPAMRKATDIDINERHYAKGQTTVLTLAPTPHQQGAQ